MARPFLWPNTVAISGDTILVGAVEGAGDLQQVHVFERNRNGANAWGFVTRLPYGPSAIADAPPIDASTAVVGGRYAPHVFERNRGGANAWGGVPPAPGVLDDFYTSRVVISGDVIATAGRQSASAFIGRVTLRAYARNQHGANAWGEIASPVVLEEPRPGEADYWDLTPAISGDTVVVGVPRSTYWGLTKTDGAGAVFAFGADLDGDGMRDGLDPCPRDPYNNIAGQCRRAAAATPIVNSKVALTNATTASVIGEMTITVTFRNTSQVPIRNPFITVAEMSGGNVLKNADGGPGGVGATLSADVGNGVFEPGETMTVRLVVGLASRNSFRFFVHVQGDL